MYLQVQITRISVETARLLYLAYTLSIAIFLSPIFLIYTGESIITSFLSAAVVFLVMAIFGRTTNLDLTNMGSSAYKMLWVVVGVSLLNLFIGSSFVQILTSIISVFVFSALISFNMQQLINIYYMRLDHATKSKLAIIGALQLLMSFINIFISLLQLFGERRR